MTVSVRLDDVHVTLGGNHILRGVSLDIAQGEFVTLLGPSGSGKSTTLNVIGGLTDTSGGDVMFDTERVNDVPPHSRDVGVVFQSYALFPHLSVGENVAFPLLTRRRPRKERTETALRMLELVQLGEMADRKVASLSGGQRQRVAIARALAASPRLLLLDEPMAALDRQLRETMQMEIKRLHARLGLTTIAVTHDQTEALTMSDKVAIMKDGLIEQYGTPEDLYHRPATRFVATFLGEANLVPVEGGRLAGFGAPYAASGTAVLRPEDLCLVGDGDGGDGIDGVLRLKVFQGSRFRLEVDHPEAGTLIVSLPPSVDASGLTEGGKVRIGLSHAAPRHVIGD
ncbi:putative spermidine/putrescine transport system ATP-binding protein [Actinocorallia herbida]|uniref:Putative spermidine/putrescine transport system ATP-binding protein n=1 Tax=Actinocorallia herbida TaxID=58109 RepID=A0A3N1D6H0_9ACTN|nr:ABC transporter ATP-binding protein [Actinocorallia herbida]ROO89125.1 putative spermidine/putrescine transport system ATP-binding protein [Actinocorallia herbida]